MPSSAGGRGVDEVGALVGFGPAVFDGVGFSVDPVLVGSSVGVTVGPSVGTLVGLWVGRLVGERVGVPVVASGVGVAEGDGTGEVVAATGSLDVVT